MDFEELLQRLQGDPQVRKYHTERSIREVLYDRSISIAHELSESTQKLAEASVEDYEKGDIKEISRYEKLVQVIKKSCESFNPSVEKRPIEKFTRQIYGKALEEGLSHEQMMKTYDVDHLTIARAKKGYDHPKKENKKMRATKKRKRKTLNFNRINWIDYSRFKQLKRQRISDDKILEKFGGVPMVRGFIGAYNRYVK